MRRSLCLIVLMLLATAARADIIVLASDDKGAVAATSGALRAAYSGKVVGLAYAAGALTHVLLFMGYGLYKAGVIGNTGLLVHGAVIGFTPIILAALASRFFKPQLLRPVPAQ